MAWIQINTTAAEALAEPLSDAFMECNSASVTFQDAEDRPIFEPELGTTPIWETTRVTALFDAEVDGKAMIEMVKQIVPAASELTFKIDQLEDKDWIREWMDQFQPMQFGDNLWIIPSWCEAPNPEAINLMLDPGMAFGTGTHPTTAMCLRWLDANPPADKTVIDYGCGSGVLALAACKLGAAKVSGTDIDPQAIQASQQNAADNEAEMHFALVKDFDSEPVDLLIANILSGPLKELASEFQRLVKTGGQLVLSGLLQTQAAELQEHYKDFGFELNTLETEEEWARLSGHKVS
ncbi:50S ribosomal protein L11 methyltransferase [Thiomicrorhabdus sp. 6S2-11]|uniref:Ribosomal protein L11 methyltransferase n=1 Tax=Thiomicrorhabdus marina TaxID=2818442 RepID=A0ABS3Q3V0_9GAMM|nr:50S ribosomal protein L11 methyltransferase [Thiomicrorhabdus marina]MBO1927012.1 50S ribosomal protein L11 methyltransferase [Thiomicrorhabdus marina]